MASETVLSKRGSELPLPSSRALTTAAKAVVCFLCISHKLHTGLIDEKVTLRQAQYHTTPCKPMDGGTLGGVHTA